MPAGSNARPGPLTFAIAAILRTAFLEQLTTQAKFGARLNIPQTTISDYLRGERVIDVETLARLCEALDLDMGEVVVFAQRSVAASKAK